jgi:hypothetical protein
VDGQERREVQQRCPLDREQQDQDRGGERRELLVAGAPARKVPLWSDRTRMTPSLRLVAR